MTDIISIAFQPENLFLTILLIFFLGLNLISLIGVFDFDFLEIDVDMDGDIDIDLDADFDLDVDTDTDVDVNSEGGGSSFISLLKFFHVGTLPPLVILTVWLAIMWGISLYVNFNFNNGSVALSLLYLIPNVIVSAFITKYVLYPFRGMFKSINKKGDKETIFEGQSCTVILEASEAKIGQAEVKDNDRIITVNIKSLGGILVKGSKCVIIEKGADNFFLAQKIDA